MITSLTIMSENSVLNRLRLGDEQLANQENSTTSSSLNSNNNSSSSRSNHTAMSSPIQVHTYPSHQQQPQHNGQQYHPESDYFLINSYLYHSSMSPPMIPDHSSSFSCSLNSNASRNPKPQPQQQIANSAELDSVSTFLPLDEIIMNDKAVAKNETVSKILADVHAQEGKIDNLIRVLSFHPNFLKEFLSSYNYLMYSQGALSYDSRHYLALMASSRHKCIYLVKQQEKEFLSANGQKNWLMGLDHIPQKLKDLNEINKLLCHQPWLINEEHIAKLLKGQFSWSLTELIMAITILTHFHAIAGFVFGSGINDNYLQQLQLEENNRRAQAELEKAAAAAAAAARLQHKHNRAEYDEDSDEELSEDECNDENYDKTRNFGSRSRASYRSEAAVFRTRSDSTGTANRTLSNSSASSCELGIDMLLKEMQMIQADDKSSSKSLNKSSSSLLIGRGAMVSPTASTNLLSSSLQNAAHVNLSSGTTTITNSPISSSCNGHISSYLTDLSNCANPKAFQAHAHHLVGVKAGKSAALNIHDNNNNKIDENEDNGAGAGSLIEDESDADSDECDESRNDEHNDSNNNSLLKANNTKLIQDKLNNRKQQHQQTPVSSGSARLNTSSVVAKTNKYMLKYAYDPDYARLNFKNADQTLKLEYYTWDSQGFVTAYNIYPDICEFLDRNFKIAGNMTYNTMGSHKQVDTSLFRRAVWNYIHSLFGIHYDDYDYKQIKKLLGSPLRNYIKILCSCPERITKKDYDSIMKEFTHSEKVHVNIVIMEARIQASMLYFLRAVNSYFG